MNNVVAMGYCSGAAAVPEPARSGADLKGFATFHGGLQTPEGQDCSNAGGEILVMHGTADTAITMDQFAALAVELENAGLEREMITTAVRPVPSPFSAPGVTARMPTGSRGIGVQRVPESAAAGRL